MEGFPVVLVVKNPPANAGNIRDISQPLLSNQKERKGNGKLFFNVYKVSVMQNE